MAGASVALEDIVFSGPPPAYDIDRIELIDGCARQNGLQEWQGGDAPGAMRSEPLVGGHPSGLTGRELVVEVGSGLVDAYIDAEEHRDEAPNESASVTDSTPRSESDFAADLGLTTDEFIVLHVGPITAPESGAQFDGGCAEWAAAEAADLHGLDELEQMRNDYSRELQSYIDASPEMADIEQRWSECMADAGYPGLREQGDHIQAVVEKLRALQLDQVSAPEARSFDVQITLAAWDCSETLNAERMELRDVFAAEYADANGIDLP